MEVFSLVSVRMLPCGICKKAEVSSSCVVLRTRIECFGTPCECFSVLGGKQFMLCMRSSSIVMVLGVTYGTYFRRNFLLRNVTRPDPTTFTVY